jgi:hypothetical protein
MKVDIPGRRRNKGVVEGRRKKFRFLPKSLKGHLGQVRTHGFVKCAAPKYPPVLLQLASRPQRQVVERQSEDFA